MSLENDDFGILQLVYTSHGTKPFSDAELLDLLVKARAYNAANAITGVLMYNDDFFAQCLEGPVVETYGLFRRIKEDTRHHNIVLVFDELTEERVFSEWSMGYTGLSASEGVQLATADWEKVEQQHLEAGTASPGFVLLQSLWDVHKSDL